MASAPAGEQASTMAKPDPFHPVDDAARILARRLIGDATFAALAVLQDNLPTVSRIALATTPDGAPLSLISTLSVHTSALIANPACALLVGEPEHRGDPLTHPRLTLQATAEFIPKDGDIHAELRAHYLAPRPKSKLYVDFADFHLVRFDMTSALLNGGFGRAYKLCRADLSNPR